MRKQRTRQVMPGEAGRPRYADTRQSVVVRKLLMGMSFSLLALLVAGLFFQRHAMACELLPVLDYRQIHAGAFVVTDTPEDHALDYRDLIDAASNRIESVYGAPASRPRIVFAPSSQAAGSWGANDTASMHRMPWRACIVLGPEGSNVDVIAHEWLHAEIQHRVGFARFLLEIPVWFDEGAALTLDYRAPFLPQNINVTDAEVRAVRGLASGREFFSGDVHLNYQAARLSVKHLVRRETFFEDLERIRGGESFETVFLASED